jgi:cytochrome b pre-mRNA-processing protein 3
MRFISFFRARTRLLLNSSTTPHADTNMLKWLTGRKETQFAAQRLYDAIVAQSRLPVFYLRHGVPDTVTGRFEMIVVHMFLVLERLQVEPGEGSDRAAQLGQALNEAFIGDMDSAMREMGVADVRVGKRMHQAAGAFFGRLMAYRKAIETSPAQGYSKDSLADALARNVLAEAEGEGTSPGSPWQNSDTAAVTDRAQAALALAGYMRTAAVALSGISLDAMSAGEVVWPVTAPALDPALDNSPDIRI